MRSEPLLVSLLMVSLVAGCGGSAGNSASEDTSSAYATDPPIPVAPVDTAKPSLTPAELRRRLHADSSATIRQFGGQIRYVSLFQAGVTDITPLSGLPLIYLDLTGLPISDLTPLKGMPLKELYLENTQVNDVSVLTGMPLQILRMERTDVNDITPLAGMKLRQLNLFGTKVRQIDAVRDMPLGTLWLTDTQVNDLSPLRGKSLESLDIENTPISDISVLAGMTTLKRLNVAGSGVTDLTPLEGLQLDRLIFTPSRIEQGIEVVRRMKSLDAGAQGMGIGLSFDTVMPASVFWPKYDAGDFNE